MSQMPDSIYLHKDCKYNTSGEYIAADENRILFDNEYDETVMDDYIEYIPVYRLEEAVKQAQKNTIEKAIKVLINLPSLVIPSNYIAYFRKKMMEE